MNELDVWKAVLEYARAAEWEIICACPPGATAYAFRACSFADSEGNIDGPDVVLLIEGTLVFVECKPTFYGILRASGYGENDIMKLERMNQNMIAGIYDDQLLNNYDVDPKNLRDTRIAIAYGGKSAATKRELIHFVVDKGTRSVEVLGTLS